MVLVAAMTVMLPMISMAESATAPMGEVQMFLASKVTLDQARAIALKDVPGTLSSIGFNDENGRGVYEAKVVATDGSETLLNIDANTSDLLGEGLASVMADHEQGVGETGGEGQDAETNG